MRVVSSAVLAKVFRCGTVSSIVGSALLQQEEELLNKLAIYARS